MKKMLLTIIACLSILAVKPQSVLYYNFLNSLNEVGGAGPALTVLGTQGSYVTDTLNEIGSTDKTVYRFEKNSGVQFNNVAAGNFIGESYTIELYFVFDELSSWKRVVDWKNRKTDWGAYVYYGQLNFYNILYSQEAPVAEGEYTYYVITRDAATKELNIYTDAEVEINFTDNNGDALIDGDGVLNFFYDDLSVPNEASSGAVAMLKLYNYALDSTAIRTTWNSLGSSVFGINDAPDALKFSVYPNPASSFVKVDLSGFPTGQELQWKIFDISGKPLLSGIVHSTEAQLTIPVSSLAGGLYNFQLSGRNRVMSTRFIVK